ncbi:MAG: NAD-dependent epimerase [Devosia sp.]|uniref:D-erythronate dehydrogenase n=1 Tax=Devosia sp. TaxID=1871048 RepID=UPI00262FB485|nr:D-erythronate dehydrogenase [Devosia sp.]MDB5530066.1 NAD-dependent epimerase [Devosia sp.]
MKVLIIGAAGMVGRKLTAALLQTGTVGDAPITGMILADVIAPTKPDTAIPTQTIAADLSSPGIAEQLLVERPDLIFHLAAIVSGEAEADFEKGYRINLDGTRLLFEAIRHAGAVEHYCPRVVFTSSIAVFGQPFPAVISDTQHHTPLTSYGTQKAICELLLADYSRRGFLDGVGIRLPTIVVRPGKPNKAASGFFSGILREPLNGQEAILPVADSVRHWFASPRAAVGFLLHAATLDTAQLGAQRNLSMPGISATVAEEIAALERAAGPKAVALIRREPDPTIVKIVDGWAQDFDPQRAIALGFTADADLDALLRVYIDDELGGKIG